MENSDRRVDFEAAGLDGRRSVDVEGKGTERVRERKRGVTAADGGERGREKERGGADSEGGEDRMEVVVRDGRGVAGADGRGVAGADGRGVVVRDGRGGRGGGREGRFRAFWLKTRSSSLDLGSFITFCFNKNELRWGMVSRSFSFKNPAWINPPLIPFSLHIWYSFLSKASFSSFSFSRRTAILSGAFNIRPTNVFSLLCFFVRHWRQRKSKDQIQRVRWLFRIYVF